MKYKGYIFDLDGVLIDSSKIHYDGLRKVLSRYDKVVDFETYLKRYFGKRGEDTLELIFGEGKISPDEAKSLSDEVDSHFVEMVGEIGVLIPGALEFVRALKEAGEKVALATSALRKNVDAFLNAFSFQGVFDAEVCADDVSIGKPEPEVFLKAALQLNEDPQKCVIFEDSFPGVIAAKAAGATCVALLTTTSRDALKAADYFINDFLDDRLKKIVPLKNKVKV